MSIEKNTDIYRKHVSSKQVHNHRQKHIKHIAETARFKDYNLTI